MDEKNSGTYGHNVEERPSIDINSLGLNKKQMDKRFKDVVSGVVKKDINRHEHWLRGFGRFCAVCGVKVICVENEL